MVINLMTLWYFLSALVSGILAGMGMGGGTLLIPALTLLLDVEQTMAQAINLLVFLPCAIVVICVYSKDKLVDFKSGYIPAIAASVVSIFAAIFALKLSSEILSICFGAFIALVGLTQIIIYTINKVKKVKGA